MHKDLFSIGPLTVHGYGLFIAIGVIAALLVAMYRAKKHGLDKELVFNITLLVAITGILGAKLLYIILNWKDFIADPVKGLTEGFVVYGGIILGIVVGYIYIKRKKAVFSDYFDIIMPGVAIAQGFGRIGCFMAGCCYGVECDGPMCVVFPENSLAPSGVSLFPTQLVSALGNFLIAAILILASRKLKYSGFTGSLYLVLYAVGRFAIEFFRADERGNIGPLSTSQFISIIMIAVAVVLFIYYGRKKIPAARIIKDGGGDDDKDDATEDAAEEDKEDVEGDIKEDAENDVKDVAVSDVTDSDPDIIDEGAAVADDNDQTAEEAAPESAEE